MDLHRESLVIDGHTDVPTRLWEAPADLSQRLTDRHVDLPRLKESRSGGGRWEKRAGVMRAPTVRPPLL